VAALRNGTIGWTLDGLSLAHGARGRAPEPDAATRSAIAQAARIHHSASPRKSASSRPLGAG